MNSLWARESLRIITCVAVASLFALAATCRAQITNQNQVLIGASTDPAQDQLYVGTADSQAEKEQADAYQAFFKEREPAKKVQLGISFLHKYPNSLFAERVDVGLLNAYQAEQDWANAYRFADYALALNPDDVDILATIGWTIPHVYSPNDPDADQELNKAEAYAKHAIEVMVKIPKPRELTDAQFATAKARRTVQAHSALGLVYFRRQNYNSSAKELEQSTEGNPTPDPTDLFVLGVDLQNLNRNAEAADAFRGCSQIVGPLQNQCKQSADSAKVQADQSKIE